MVEYEEPENGTERETVSGEEILAYTVKRRFPLPIDGIYKAMPHFIKLKIHGGLEHLKTKGTVIWVTRHQSVWDQYFLRHLATKIGGRSWNDVYPFAWGGDMPGKGFVPRLKELIMRFFFLVQNTGHAYLVIKQGRWRKDVEELAQKKAFVLLVSPEGPSIQMTKARLAAGILQRDLKVPVIPNALWGLNPFQSLMQYSLASFVEWLRCFPVLKVLPNPFLPKKRLVANFMTGEPIYPFDDQGSEQDRQKIYQEYTDRIMVSLATMLPEAFRGYYRDWVK
jgi:1-acyl-sn-glycerol-3-phosphate acyltransferase